VVDSETLVPFFNWIDAPLHRDQISFFDCLFSSSEVAIILFQKYDFLSHLQQVFDNFSITNEHRAQLLTIIISFCVTVDGESNPFLLPIFESFVSPLIHTEDRGLFELVLHLFTILLESREEAVLTNFMFSDIDFFLMERFPLCRHSAQEQILRGFLAISGGSRDVTQSIFERFICRYPISLFQAHEEFQSLIVRIASNTLSLGPSVLDIFGSNGILDLSLELQNMGKFESRKSAIFFFSNLCVMVDNPSIESFLINHRIVSVFVEFLSFSTKDTWVYLLNGFMQLRNHIDGNPFKHPLFEGVDTGEFYTTLCDIHDYPGLETFDKGLYANVGNFLELFDERGEEFMDPF
jgi:hypothetical protein